MEDKNNPFYGKIYRGPKFFCDRKEETKQLTEYMANGVNVTLFAKRRLGKTGLLHHLFYKHRNNTNMVCMYADVLATNNLTEFTNHIATAVYNGFPPQKTLGKKKNGIVPHDFKPSNLVFDETYRETPFLKV